ncbi:MAG: hypothetical protein ACPG6B_05685 [Oceanihabitans sp.]
MKKILLLFFLVTFLAKAQEINLPKNPKVGDKFIYCFNECNLDGQEGKWQKVFKNTTIKTIVKLQKRLNYLDYKVVETGLLDFQTKTQIKLFNTENNIGCHNMYTYDTEKLIKQKYKAKKKANKHKR